MSSDALEGGAGCDSVNEESVLVASSVLSVSMHMGMCTRKLKFDPILRASHTAREYCAMALELLRRYCCCGPGMMMLRTPQKLA